MSQHPIVGTRVSEKPQPRPEVTFPAFYQGQESGDSPDHFLSLSECRRLRDAGLGAFINRGKAFRRFDTATPRDPNNYGGCTGRADSADINPAMMDRYLLAMTDQVGAKKRDLHAIAAVESWAFNFS